MVYPRSFPNLEVIYTSLPQLLDITNQTASNLQIALTYSLFSCFPFIYTLNFMPSLSVSKEDFNMLMSITYRFLKQITFILEKDIYSAEILAYAFLYRLDLIDQSLPAQPITNKDHKFLHKFWKVIFKKLVVKLFYSNEYHLSTNKSSKHLNPTVGIALRYFIYYIKIY